MGMEKNSNSNVGSDGNCSNSNNIDTQVVLNVYDLTPVNSYTYWFGFGIFHSGIQVHGKEYGFGAHEFPVSGVFEVEPKTCPGFIYRNSISLGRTNMSPTEFRKFIENVAAEYHGDVYHLITKNCNHFTDDISRRLTGKRIPSWVNRLARIGVLCSCLLPESLQVASVKQMPEYHEYSDGTTDTLSPTPPRYSIENNDSDQEKRLLSPASGSDEVAFVKETEQPS